MRILALLIAAVALCSCSSDDDDSSNDGGSSGSGGSAGAAACIDSTNPMFGSCVEAFIAGCWAPDLSGTCTDDSGTVSWSDGSKYQTQGNMSGMYGPGDTSPCIAMTFSPTQITATKGSETLSYVPDTATSTATVTCPDGSTFSVSFDQVTAFNECVGLNCP